MFEEEDIHEKFSGRLTLTIDISDRLADFLERLIPKPTPKTGDIFVNYIVKDDNPDVGFAVTVGGVTDAEGQPIPDAQVIIEVASTDESVLSVAANADGKSGTVHFGAPGQASFNVTAKDAAGNVLATGSDGFTVTTGDPAAITSISTSFDGLTGTP